MKFEQNKWGLYLTLMIFSEVPLLAFAAEVPSDAGPWWVGHLITFLGIVVGARMIMFQLSRQQANESARQAENSKGQLRLQIYQEFSDCLSSAEDSISAAGMYATLSQTHSSIFRQQILQALNPKPITDRAIQFLDKNALGADKAIQVVFLIEKYFIVHPDIDIFRIAINSGLHDLNKAFQDLFQFMLTNFPVDTKQFQSEGIQNVKVLNEKELEHLKKLSEVYHEAALDLCCYLGDMRTELQILLIGHLFPNSLPKRRPADPSKKVLSLDPMYVKNLRNHLYKNTAWGKTPSKYNWMFTANFIVEHENKWE